MLDDLINAWHDAVNERDLAAAQAVVTDSVQVSGPRGTQSIPAADFAAWIVRSGIRLRPLAVHPIDASTVVVEQEATWPETPQPTTVATLFRVRDGAISAVHRHATVTEARADAES